MRIQHNVSAMNSYRNFSANTSKLSKNLEKLSTGYKINRAGDDAAGLAISEKMRAQISGITGAEKNAKDGISLIQTAEGALTEVHDMLNRMTTLAEQSANGTYDNKLDRAQLQKEVDSLKSEIDRIADSTNYNGIKLLDGSMSVKNGATTIKTQFNDAGSATELTVTTGATFSQELTISGFSSDNLVTGDTVTMSFTYMDKDNKAQDVTVSAKVNGTANSDVAKAMESELKKVFGNDYPVSASGQKLTFEAQSGNVTEDTQIVSQSIKFKVNGTDVEAAAGYKGDTSAAARTAGKSDLFTIDMSSATLGKKNFLEIDGKRFQILTRGQSADEGATGIYIDQSSSTINGDSTKQIVEQLQANGVAARVNSSTATSIDINKTNVIADKGQGGLTLQIGDTGDSYNTLRVSVSDMHSSSIGIGGVDISTQEGAQAALDKIKGAVNFVSDVRGGLGALQNRLDHTINNLGVMKENITSAESLIRDTDVAEEMMTYTKNNILNQASQAMLAQANQLPQGVLQLLG
jgi:flagellin